MARAEYQVAVEADQFDLEAAVGWFVLARGAAHHLDTEAERASIVTSGPETWVGLEQWVEGEESAHFIRARAQGVVATVPVDGTFRVHRTAGLPGLGVAAGAGGRPWA